MNQTIYFRKDVWDKFKDEAGKSNLVNQLLASHYSLNPRDVTVDDRPLREPDVYLLSPKVAKEHPETVPTIPGVVRGADFVPKPPDPETGYPCCTKKRPCRHWHYDGNEGVWRNELTSKTREVI